MRKGRNTHSVNLYERKLKSGKIQLLLSIYADGKRIQESTGILIDPQDSKMEIKKKKAAAEAFRKKRAEELDNVFLGISEGYNQDAYLFQYFDSCYSTLSKATQYSWKTTKRYLMDYESNHNITMRYITKSWIIGFREYILNNQGYFARTNCDKKVQKTLKSSSASVTFDKLIACLKKAYKEGIITHDITASIDRIPRNDSERGYLTKEELKKLSNTPCKDDVVKRAFLFGCMTGIRISDIKSMRWENVKRESDTFEVSLIMQKTKESIYMSINKAAQKLMGEPKNSGLVFDGLKGNRNINTKLRDWAESAGLDCYITFHISRHTFATLLISKGNDIYVVSKLLGHADINTTQIYAKIVDKRKKKAVDSISSIL